MRNLKTCLLLILTMGIFATSCKKDEASNTELLTTEGGWTFSSSSDNSAEVEADLVALILLTLPEVDRTPENEALIAAGTNLDVDFEMDDCDKDDVLIFNTDGSVIERSGTVKCSSSEPDEANGGTWAFNSDETQLIITDPSFGAFTYHIGSLSSSTLDLEIREPLSVVLDDIEVSGIENVEGYDEFVNSDLIYTITFRAN